MGLVVVKLLDHRSVLKMYSKVYDLEIHTVSVESQFSH